VDPADLTDEATYEAHADAIGELRRELLRCANAEAGQPHRPALLAWHSGKVVPAEADLMAWATAHLSRLVMENGGLVPAAEAVHQAEQERRAFNHDLHIERAARVRLYVESGMSTLDAIALAQQPVELDAGTVALLERAEQFLQQENPR
jgi:hypothetical protein